MNSSFWTGNWSMWINNSSSGQPPSSIFFEFHILKNFLSIFFVTRLFLCSMILSQILQSVKFFSPMGCMVSLLYLNHCKKKNVHHTSAKILNNNLNIVFQCKNMHSIPLTQPLSFLWYLQIILCYYSSYTIYPLYASHSTYQYGQTFSQDHPYRCIDC